MATMRDIAREAGVSISTVSHVVNGTRHVNEDTAQQVRRAMDRIGYVNDEIARSLRTGTTKSVGLAMSAISNPYFGDVVLAVEQALSAHGFSLLLADTHDDPTQEMRAVSDLLRHRPEGVLLAPSSDPVAVVARLRERQVPFVSVDRILPGVDSVGVYNVEPTRQLVSHLLELGHRRIAMVAGRQGITTSEERIEGYRRALLEVGVGMEETMVVRGDSDEDITAAEVTRLLGLPDDKVPTALLVGNNRMTIGAMRALRQLGVSVPNDLALVAFDDFEWADLFHPRLTTLAQPTEAIGRTAVELLRRRQANPHAELCHIRLDPLFRHRESCGCPAS